MFKTSNPPDHAHDPDRLRDADLHAEAHALGYRLAIRCQTCGAWLVAERSVREHRGPVCRSKAATNA